VGFAGGSICLDCILGPSWAEPGAPATLQVLLPPAGASAGPVRTLLRQWAGDGVPIEVTVAADERGATVTLSAPLGRIVLEPSDSAA